MSIFDDMIYGLKQDTEIPKDVWKKYTDTLSNLPDKQGEPSSHTFFKKSMWPTVAVVALVIGTVSVSAATYMQWSKGLEERLQVTTEQRRKLERNQMASFVGQSVTQGNVTVTAQQCIVDNYFAHLSFKIEGYKVEDGNQPGFSDTNIIVGDNANHTGGWSASFYDGLLSGADGTAIHADGTPLKDGEIISYTMKDGSLEYHVDMMSETKGAFLNQPIHVELKDLGIYSGKAEDVAVEAEGTWSFDWVLTGSDEMKKYTLNIPLENSGATVLQAELSPISASVTYQFPRQKETEKATDENGEEITHTYYKEPPILTGVRLKDGTIYKGISGSGISGYISDDSDLYRNTAALERVIDVDQVESLVFVKSSPESEQPLTEDNLYFVSVNK